MLLNWEYYYSTISIRSKELYFFGFDGNKEVTMKYSKELIGQRLLYKRKQKGWKQVDLADRINEKLNREKNMLSKQISVYESGKTIPPLDILIILCDIFDCNLDYFLCEEEQKSSIEDVALIEKDLGLDRKAVQIIKKYTGNKKASVDSGCNYTDYRNILNNYLKALSFRKIVRLLFHIINKTNEYNGITDNLEAEYGKEKLSEAKKYITSDFMLGKTDKIKGSKEQKEMLIKYRDALKDQSILKSRIKGYSYEYMESCRSLMMHLCPKIKD